MNKLTEEKFLADVAKHELNVRHDQGVYRELVFRDPQNSCMWFGLTTWPGHLCYHGDMGTFVFQRTRDMLDFFRGKLDGPLKPNFGYWAEKLQAIDRIDGHTEFSVDLFRAAVEESIKDFMDCAAGADEFDTFAELRQFESELRAAVQDEIYFTLDEYRSKDRALQAAFDFRFEKYNVIFNLLDFCENNFDIHTLRFLWACYAITWGIRMYDNITSQTGDSVQCQ